MIHFDSLNVDFFLGLIVVVIEIVVIPLLLILAFYIFYRVFKRNPYKWFWYGRLARSFQTPESVVIWQCLKDNTADSNGQRYKSVKEISEALNLTDEQVRRGCFYNPFIFQLNEDYEEKWTIYPDGLHKTNPYQT